MNPLATRLFIWSAFLIIGSMVAQYVIPFFLAIAWGISNAYSHTAPTQVALIPSSFIMKFMFLCFGLRLAGFALLFAGAIRALFFRQRPGPKSV
jgi:hypothetical protein